MRLLPIVWPDWAPINGQSIFRAREMKRAGHDIIELTIGEPDIPTPIDMIDVADKGHARGPHRLLEWSRRAGCSSGAVRQIHSTHWTSDRSGKHHVLLRARKRHLSLVMLGLAEEGDEIITGDPLYATYDGVVRATGATRVSVPLRPEKGFRMQAVDLEKVITPKSRVLLLNTPHNPTGAVLSAQEWRKSAKFAANTISGSSPMKFMS